MFMHALLLLVKVAVLSGQLLQCPENASFFDFDPCDPNRRSQCPAGFACRRGTQAADPSIAAYLCCDASSMTIADWFTDAQLSPQIIPQLPLSLLPTIQLADLGPGTVSPEIHIGDEIITLAFPDFTTAIVNSVQLMQPVATGGYVHSITLIDATKKPWALFASINIPWPGGQLVDLTAARRGNGAFFTFVSNETVPLQISYRSQYVVLLFHTAIPVPSALQDDVSKCADAACVFMQSTAQGLGTPIAGSFFYLTTLRSPFALASPVTSSSATSMMSVPLLTLLWSLHP